MSIAFWINERLKKIHLTLKTLTLESLHILCYFLSNMNTYSGAYKFAFTWFLNLAIESLLNIVKHFGTIWLVIHFSISNIWGGAKPTFRKVGFS